MILVKDCYNPIARGAALFYTGVDENKSGETYANRLSLNRQKKGMTKGDDKDG